MISDPYTIGSYCVLAVLCVWVFVVKRLRAKGKGRFADVKYVRRFNSIVVIFGVILLIVLRVVRLNAE